MDPWINYAAVYVAILYAYLKWERNDKRKSYWLAFLNVLFTFFCFFGKESEFQWQAFSSCIVLVVVFYAFLKHYKKYPYIFYFFPAVMVPLSALVAMKMGYLPGILGFSYLVFRLVYLVYEVYLGRVRSPSFANYIGFAFFPLTFLVGPINPYSYYEKSLRQPDRNITPLPRSLGRVLIGILKCYIISELFRSLSFSVYWDTGYYHGITDFIISCIATTFYIYFNFSGICDIVIGAAGVLNIRVKENFNNPFLSHNLAEFWTRNHISLTQILREMFFTPGVLALGRLLGPRWSTFSVIVMTMVIFLIIGMWHGTGAGYVLFGLAHGLGVSVVTLYSLAWQRMSPRFQRFTQKPAMRFFSMALTFSYICLTGVFFGNDLGRLQDILNKIVL